MGRTSQIADIHIARAWNALCAEKNGDFEPTPYALREFFRSNERREQIGLPTLEDPPVPSYGRIHSQLDRIRAQLRLGLNPADPSQPAPERNRDAAIADIGQHLHELVQPFAAALYAQAEQRAQKHDATLISLREDKQVLEQQLVAIEAELQTGREQVAQMQGVLQEMQAQRERDRQALEQSKRATANAMKAKDDLDVLLAKQHQENKKQTQAFTKLIAAGSRTENTLRQTLTQIQQQHQKLQGQFEKLKETESEQRAYIKSLKADLKRATKQSARTPAKKKPRE